MPNLHFSISCSCPRNIWWRMHVYGKVCHGLQLSRALQMMQPHLPVYLHIQIPLVSIRIPDDRQVLLLVHPFILVGYQG